MSRPFGFKHTEETKAKLRKPHRKMTAEEKEAKSRQMSMYHEARREFVRQYQLRKEQEIANV